jgi:hypothetical protein
MTSVPKLNRDYLNILLVGLGKVGMSYDFSGPPSQVLTHAKAIHRWSGESLTSVNVVGVDIDSHTQLPFEKIFNSGKWFSRIESVDFKEHFDLAVIATPISTLATDAMEVSKRLSVEKFVIEKPAAANFSELKNLMSLPQAKEDFIVGFPRPSLPSSLKLKRIINSIGAEEPWSVSINYGGSVLNILSHFLNLIEFLVEPFELQCSYVDTNKFLVASFTSKSGRLAITSHQYSLVNDEKNEIHFRGPIDIWYKNSGRHIRIADSRKGLSRIIELDCESEISQMIGIFGRDYLNWASKDAQSNFTRLSSYSLFESIKLSEAMNNG